MVISRRLARIATRQAYAASFSARLDVTRVKRVHELLAVVICPVNGATRLRENTAPHRVASNVLSSRAP
jgi:hypothetical protein